MDNIYLKRIDERDKNYYAYYKIASLWDKKQECFSSKYDDFDLLGLMSNQYVLYLNDDMIGYGIITILHNLNLDSESYLTYIIKPEYRNKGYGKLLIKLLEEVVQKDLKIDVINVEILKRNLSSISLVENSNYEFDHFDDKKIVFKKEFNK